jgi:stress response protein YsnF
MPRTNNPHEPSTSPERSTEAVVNVVQEELSVSSLTTETGAVRVRKVVREETKVVPTEVRTETVRVERIPAGHRVEAEYPPREEGNVTVIPVFEYRPVVEQHLFLVEEIRLIREVSKTAQPQEVTLRQEEVVIERREGDRGAWKEHPPDEKK